VTRAWRAATAVVLAGLSCEPELSLEEALRNRHCEEGGASCVPGYVCGPESVCVPEGSLNGAGAGASIGGEPGAGSSSGGAASSSGGAASSNAGSSNGGAGSSNGGAAGENDGATASPPDAGAGAAGNGGLDAGVAPPDPPDASPADAGCTPVRIFRDRDADGFGSILPADQDFACAPPEGFVTVGGDCFDAVPTTIDRADRVHPGQEDFFITGYHPDPSVFSVVSFDYDCSGTEDPDPENDFGGNDAPDCGEFSVPCAARAGFELSGRTGSDAHPLCGSEIIVTCIAAGNACVSSRSEAVALFACH
jgi:hypothetical protein